MFKHIHTHVYIYIYIYMYIYNVALLRYGRRPTHRALSYHSIQCHLMSHMIASCHITTYHNTPRRITSHCYISMLCHAMPCYANMLSPNVYMYIYIYIYARNMYICMRMCAYVCMYIYIYIYIGGRDARPPRERRRPVSEGAASLKTGRRG